MSTIIKEKRKRQHVDESKIKAALNDVLEGLSLRKSAKKYEINPGTLQKRFQKMKNSTKDAVMSTANSNSWSNRIFSIDQENQFSEYAKECRSFIEVRKCAYNFAKQLGCKFPYSWEIQGAAGVDWLKGFIKRQHEKNNKQSEPANRVVLAQKRLNLDEFKRVEFEDSQKLISFKSLQWSCCLCAYMHSAYIKLVEHLSKQHNVGLENMSWRCTFCGRCFTNYALFLNHTRSNHVHNLNLCCDLCGEKQYKITNLALHREENCSLISSTLLPMVYHCRYCFEVFSNQDELKKHLEFETGLKIEQLNFDKLPNSLNNGYRCRYCNKTFRNSNARSGHENRHSGLNPFTCSNCLSSFPSLFALERHNKLPSRNKNLKGLTACQIKVRLSDNENNQLHITS